MKRGDLHFIKSLSAQIRTFFSSFGSASNPGLSASTLGRSILRQAYLSPHLVRPPHA
ncbi:MAG: hypothetical protein LBD55_07150 [Treponema sp.]|nr:hypothetical protein [Treponema sp.]